MPKYNSDELGSLIQSVADNLIDAGIHYRLFRDLVEAVPDHSVVLNDARAFWTLTFVGHRDAALFRICRVYDQERRAIGFRTLLGAIQENTELFDEGHFRARLKGNLYVDDLARVDRIPPPQQLLDDIAATSDQNDLVKRLVILRNNIFAHTSREYVLRPDRFKAELGLEADDVWALIDRGLGIVNRYADMFHAHTYAKEIVGRDDYNSVLNSLKRDNSARQERIYEEMKAAGALDLEGNYPPVT